MKHYAILTRFSILTGRLTFSTAKGRTMKARHEISHARTYYKSINKLCITFILLVNQELNNQEKSGYFRIKLLSIYYEKKTWQS